MVKISRITKQNPKTTLHRTASSYFQTPTVSSWHWATCRRCKAKIHSFPTEFLLTQWDFYIINVVCYRQNSYWFWSSPDVKVNFPRIRTLICLTVQTEQAKWFNRLQNCSVIFTHYCELLWISILFVSSQHQQLLTYAHIRNISLDDSFISYQNQSCHIDWVSHSLYDQADHSCAALVDNKVSLPQEPQRGRLWCSARDGQSQNQPS